LVLVRWTYLYISFSRGARLITGNDHLLVDRVPRAVNEPAADEIDEPVLPD
jgi:hypothetical protein